MALSEVKTGVAGLDQDTLRDYLEDMSPPQRQQVANMYKNSPYASLVVPLALAITQEEQQLAQAMAAQQNPQQTQQPTPADMAIQQINPQPQQLPEDQGIAQLPAQNIARMADGGIAGYADTGLPQDVYSGDPEYGGPGMAQGGAVERYQSGGSSSPKDKFIAEYGSLAQRVAEDTGIAPELILSQWGLETNWGTKTVGKFNFGNIKDVTGKGPRAVDKAEGSRDAYKTYKSPEDFASDYARLLKVNYPNALNTGSDVGAFAEGLQSGKRGAYATDPSYGKKIAQVATQLMPVSSAQAAQPAAQPPAQPAAPGQPAKPGALASFGQGLASLADVALSPASFALKQVGYAASRPFLSPEEAEKFSGEVAAPFQDVVGKTFGVTESPAYQQEASRRLFNFVGENINKGSSWIAQKLGIPETDAANMVNTVVAAGPKAVSGVAKIPEAGRAAYERVAPQQGRMSPQQVARLGEESRAAQVDAARRGAMEAGATLDEQAALAQMVQRRQQAEAPSVAYEMQQRIKPESQSRIATGTQRTGTLGAASEGETLPESDKGQGPGAANETFRKWEIQEQNRLAEQAKNMSPKQRDNLADRVSKIVPDASKFSKDDLVVFGLALMASGGKQRSLLSAVGEAGLATVAERRAQKKEEREDYYRRALAAEALGKAGYYAGGGGRKSNLSGLFGAIDKADNRARTIAQDLWKDYGERKKLAEKGFTDFDSLYDYYRQRERKAIVGEVVKGARAVDEEDQDQG